jgi:YgiT-type zinc finger domain-containing protein
MKCLYCGGEMKKVKVGYAINRKDYHLYLEEIPAYVCTKCREKLFSEDEVEAIQKIIKHLKADVRQLQAA